jgi:hypothetical protein
LPPPQEFLNCAHAIEAFHRAVIGGQYLEDAEYESGLKKILLRALPSELNPDFRSSLVRKFDFLHQFSLKKRLKDVIRRNEEILSPEIGPRDPFINIVTEARNALVHPSSERESPAYAKLWEFALQLGYILDVSILGEIGFGVGDVQKIAWRGKRADMIRNNIQVPKE